MYYRCSMHGAHVHILYIHILAAIISNYYYICIINPGSASYQEKIIELSKRIYKHT